MLPAISDAAHDAYLRALIGMYSISLDVDVLAMDGTVLTSIAPQVVDGSLSVDLDGDVQRVASLALVDPGYRLSMDTDSPADGALFLDRLARVSVRITTPALPNGLVIPQVTGPISKLDRQGPSVTLEVQGWEALGMGQAWRPQTWAKGTRKTDVIREILTERMGVKRLVIPTLSARLPADFSLGRFDSPWKVARQIAGSLNRQLLIRGDGVAVLRPWPRTVAHTFYGDREPGHVLTGSVKTTVDTSRVRNAVQVIGAKGKGAKHPVTATVVAPRSHPLSPYRLGPPGAPRYFAHTVTDGSIRTAKDAEALAKRILDDLLREEMSVEFASVPVYHLEPGDIVRLSTDAIRADSRLRQWTVPLKAQGEMTVGYRRLLVPRKAKIR